MYKEDPSVLEGVYVNIQYFNFIHFSPLIRIFYFIIYISLLIYLKKQEDDTFPSPLIRKLVFPPSVGRHIGSGELIGPRR